MLTGLSAGITWALETVMLAAALGAVSSDSVTQAALLPLAATFLHDAFSALYMLAYNTARGNLRKLTVTVKSPGFKWLVAASAVGGPVGMTGYVLAVGNMARLCFSQGKGKMVQVGVPAGGACRSIRPELFPRFRRRKHMARTARRGNVFAGLGHGGGYSR